MSTIKVCQLREVSLYKLNSIFNTDKMCLVHAVIYYKQFLFIIHKYKCNLLIYVNGILFYKSNWIIFNYLYEFLIKQFKLLKNNVYAVTAGRYTCSVKNWKKINYFWETKKLRKSFK